jgi:hypothetical protein
MKDDGAELTQLFGDIRSAVQQKPTKKAWHHLCGLLDKLDDAVLEDELLPYLRAHLSQWPHIKRPMPASWWRRVARGEHEPRAVLAGWMLLWGDMGGGDEREDSGFSMYTALCCCAIHPNLESFVLADAAEWHHNGGDIGRFRMATGKLDTLLLSNSTYHGEPSDCAYSPNGRLIALAPVEEMRRGAVHLWDDKVLRWQHELAAPQEDEYEEDFGDEMEMVALAFSHDSALLAYTSALEGLVRLVDAQTGTVKLERRDLVSPCAPAIHPDNQTLAVWARGHLGAGVYVLRGDEFVTFMEYDTPYKMLWARDGAQLAALRDVLHVMDWDGATLVERLTQRVCEIDSAFYRRAGRVGRRGLSRGGHRPAL